MDDITANERCGSPLPPWSRYGKTPPGFVENDRIALMQMLISELSRATDPAEVNQRFRAGMGRMVRTFGKDPAEAVMTVTTRGLGPGQYKLASMLFGDEYREETPALRDRHADTRGMYTLISPLPEDGSRPGPISFEHMLELATLGAGMYRPTEPVYFADESGALVNPFELLEAMPVEEGGFVGRMVRSVYPNLLDEIDVRDDPVLGNLLADYRSAMILPILEDGEPHNWGLIFSRQTDRFNVSLIPDGIMRINMVAWVMRNAMLTRQLHASNRRVQRHVSQIASIQRSLLPQSIPEVPGVSLAVSYRPSEEAGGDYYDFFRHSGEPDAPVGILIADASGHGPSAAVVMAILHAILHAYPFGGDTATEPSAVLRHVNQHLYAKRLTGSFVTAFYAVFDPRSGTLHYARAGHNPPLLRSVDGSVSELDAVGSLPLGVMDAAEFDCATVQLQPGETVVLYTDGISEAKNRQQRMFGIQRIRETITACAGDPSDILRSLDDAMSAFGAEPVITDDQTVVALRYHGPVAGHPRECGTSAAEEMMS